MSLRLLLQGKRAPTAGGGLPLLGHALSLDAERIIDFFIRSWRAAGKRSFEIDIAGRRGFVIGDWETAKRVWAARPKTFRRSAMLEGAPAHDAPSACAYA